MYRISILFPFLAKYFYTLTTFLSSCTMYSVEQQARVDQPGGHIGLPPALHLPVSEVRAPQERPCHSTLPHGPADRHTALSCREEQKGSTLLTKPF